MARLLLRDLTPGTNYKVQIRAVEGDSVSEWSRLFDLPTTADGTPPHVPVWSADAWVVNGDTFVATWLPLDFAEEDNKDFDHYEIEFGNGTTTSVLRTNNTSYTLTFEQNRILFGTPQATVTARVRAVDAVGNASNWTDLRSASNPAPNPVNSISTTALYDAVDVRWDGGTLPDDFKAYVLQVSTTSASTGFTTAYEGPNSQFQYSTIQFNTDHWFRVYVRDKFSTLSTAVTSGAVRPKSSFQVDTTAPDVPTALTAAITNNANGLGARAALTWAQVVPTANDLAGFSVRWRKVGDTNWSSTTFSHEDRAGIIELQAAFTNYEFQIRSYDWMGNNSAWSATVTATSPANTAPAQVTGLAAVAGRDSLRYTWTPITDADLKEYEVTFSTSSTFASGNITFKTGTAAYLDIGGLAAGTTYYARVRAIDNSGATGTFSATNTTATLAQLTPGDIGAPTNTQFNTAVKSYVNEYAVNSSETVAPTTGWSTTQPTRTPGSFIWFRTVVTKQDNSTSTGTAALLTGNTGATGSQGIQGPAGVDGTSLYTWLKYADTPTTGMSDDPTGKTYIGLAYNKTSATESTNYADYQWALIKGADGADGSDGVQGPPGADGQTTYTWVKYASSATPLAGDMSDSPTGKTYIGLAFNKTTATESTVPGDYQWALIQGPQGPQGIQGTQGIQGPPGADGTERYTWIKYADTPTTGMSDSPTGKTYMGIAYNKTTSTESTNYADYEWSLIKGADGAAGKGISNTVVTYQTHTNGTTAPTGTWSSTPTATTTGQFLWTRTVITYTDASTATAYSVSAHGATGSTGATGKGITGTVVTYQVGNSGTTAPTGTWLSTIPATTTGQFLWTRTVTTYSDSTTTTAYSVSAHGATGQQGIQGPAGADGQPTYTWIKYGTSAAGAGLSDDPTGKTYIGIAYNKNTATESTVATDYEWSLIQGPQGPQGIPGTPGADGITYYTWVKYADTPTTGMSDDPTGKVYMGIAYNKTNSTESTNYADYSWSLIKGADGAAGPAGKGISSTAVTYQVGSSGTTAPTGTWTTSVPATTTGQFLWTRTITTYTDASNTTAYAVSAHGATGSTGAAGKGISSTAVTYQIGTSGTTAPTGTWLSTIPATSPGQFLWTRTITTYTDATTTTAYAVSAHGATGQQGIQGPAGADGQPTYTWIKYATDVNGTGLSDDPTGKTYIGLAFNKNTATESTTATDYTWSLIQGPQGPAGSNGSNGSDGVSVTAITRYWLRQTAGGATPATPGNVASPGGSWVTAEPDYLAGTELWMMDRISYSNGTYAYTAPAKSSSYTAAVTAITAANGKNKIVFSTGDATGTAYTAGDMWYKRDANNVIIATWEFTTSWQPRTLGDGVLASLNVGKLVSGDVSAITINIKSTGAIKSDNYVANSAGWKLDAAGLEVNGGKVKASTLIGDTLGASTGTIQIAAGANIVVNGGYIKSNTYTGTTFASNPSGAGWYIGNDGIHVDSGSIAASALVTGTISGTNTITLSGANARIESAGYTGGAGTGGFRLSGSGLEIPDGTLQAAKLLLQASPNIMPGMYADFEGQVAAYASKFTADIGGVIGGVNTTGGKFGAQKMGFIWGAQASNIRIWLGPTATTYNVPVEAGKTYIFSMYTYTNAAGLNSNSIMYVKWSNGTIVTLDTKTHTIADDNPANAIRLIGVATVPAGVTGALIGWGTTTQNVSTGISIDGVQVEEKVSGSNLPSSFSRPSSTAIDGGLIRTGAVLSNAPAVDVNGNAISGLQAWQLNTDGSAVFGDALIRGKLVMGISTDYANSTTAATDEDGNTVNLEDPDKLAGIGSIQSYNYSPGLSGWAIRSNGFAEFLQLKSSSISADAIEAVSPDKLNPGTMTADIIIGSAIRSVEKETLYVTSKSRSGNVATVTLSGSHTRLIGDRIQVKLDPADAAFDTPGKTFVTVVAITDTTISYVSPNGTSGTIGATATGGTVYVEGRSVVMSPDGITLFQNNGIDRIIDLPTDTLLPAYFAGDVEANSLTVKDDFLLQGLDNAVAAGGVFTLNASVASPAGSPTFNYSWDYVGTWLDNEYTGWRAGLWWEAGFANRFVTTNAFFGSGSQGINPDGSYNYNLGIAGPDGSPFGMVKANDGKWYGLFNDSSDGLWRVRRFATSGTGFSTMETSWVYNQATAFGATAKEWKVDGWNGSALKDPVIGYGTPDGTNFYLYIARCTKAGKIIVTRYNLDGTGAVNYSTNITDNQRIKSINVGAFDYGSYRMVISTEGNSTKVATNYVTNTSGTHQTAETFSSPGNQKLWGVAWNGTNFVALTQNNRLYQHTALANTGTNVWYAKSSFFDGNNSRTVNVTAVSGNGTTTTVTSSGHGYVAGDTVYINGTLATSLNNAYYVVATATSTTFTVSASYSGSVGAGGTVTNEWETTLSNYAQSTVVRRSKLTVSTSNIPVGAGVNQADRARFYFSATAGGTGLYYRQTNPNATVSQVYTTNPVFSGNSTTQTGFPAGTPAKIVSSALNSLGNPKLELSSDGTMRSDRIVLYSTGDVSGSSTASVPLSIFQGTAQLQMDSNEMQAFSGTTPSGFTVNPFGGTVGLGSSSSQVNVNGNLNIIGTLVGTTTANGTFRTTGDIQTNYTGTAGGLFDLSYSGGGTTGAQIGNGGRVTRVSSIKMKEAIEPMTMEEAKSVLALESYTFEFKKHEKDVVKDPRRYPGFIAEQAAEAGAELWVARQHDVIRDKSGRIKDIKRNKKGSPVAFRTAEITVAHNLLIKELYAEIESLKEEVAALRG